MLDVKKLADEAEVIVQGYAFIPKGEGITIIDLHKPEHAAYFYNDEIVETSMDRPVVEMSAQVSEASEELRDFLFSHVYHDEWRKKEEARCDYILSALYGHYLKHPEQLPGEYLEIVYTEGLDRAVCDFIGCMTDRYAIDQFSSLFVPNAFDKK